MNTPLKHISIVLITCLSLSFQVHAKGSAERNTLSDTETNTLLTMREEEKLARDVYQTLYTVWNQTIFNNIGASEQKHMDALLKKINKFGLTDPALPETGRFSNPTFQTLFDQFKQLLAENKLSAIEALRIGALIEDWDIVDLTIAIAETDNVALQNTYQNLLEGSKNHLRAFVGALRNKGADYTPQYIEPVLFDAILGV